MENLVGRTFQYKNQGRFEAYEIKELTSGKIVIMTDRYTLNLYPSEFFEVISDIQTAQSKPQKKRGRAFINKSEELRPMNRNMGVQWNNETSKLNERTKKERLEEAKLNLDRYQKAAFPPTHQINRVNNCIQVTTGLNTGKWNKAEDNYIKEGYPYGDLKAMSRKLNRSVSKLMSRAYFLQVKRMV